MKQSPEHLGFYKLLICQGVLTVRGSGEGGEAFSEDLQGNTRVLACAYAFIHGGHVHIHVIQGELGFYMDFGEWEGVSRVNKNQ